MVIVLLSLAAASRDLWVFSPKSRSNEEYAVLIVFLYYLKTTFFLYYANNLKERENFQKYN